MADTLGVWSVSLVICKRCYMKKRDIINELVVIHGRVDSCEYAIKSIVQHIVKDTKPKRMRRRRFI